MRSSYLRRVCGRSADVEIDGRSDQGLERRLVELRTLDDVDRPPRARIEAGVEQAVGVVERRSVHECDLHLVLVDLTGADDAVVRPRGDAGRIRRLGPLRLLGDLGVGFLDEHADPVATCRDANRCRPCQWLTVSLGRAAKSRCTLRYHFMPETGRRHRPFMSRSAGS